MYTRLVDTEAEKGGYKSVPRGEIPAYPPKLPFHSKLIISMTPFLGVTQNVKKNLFLKKKKILNLKH